MILWDTFGLKKRKLKREIWHRKINQNDRTLWTHPWKDNWGIWCQHVVSYAFPRLKTANTESQRAINQSMGLTPTGPNCYVHPSLSTMGIPNGESPGRSSGHLLLFMSNLVKLAVMTSYVIPRASSMQDCLVKIQPDGQGHPLRNELGASIA